MAFRAHLHATKGAVVACETLAETFPPQPGGARVVVVGADPEARPSAQRAGDDVWTAALEPVRGTWRGERVHVEDP